MKSLLLLALGLTRTVILGVRIEAERIVVTVRPHKKAQRRCPVCGRACEFYDMANRGCLIWAHEGTGKEVLGLFLDELTREQRRAIPLQPESSRSPVIRVLATITSSREDNCKHCTRAGGSIAPSFSP